MNPPYWRGMTRRDTPTTSHSLSSSLTSVHGRTVSKQISPGAWSSTRTGPRPKKGTGAWVYRCGLRRGHSFNLWLHTTVFQPKKMSLKHTEERIWKWDTQAEHLHSFQQSRSHKGPWQFPDKLQISLSLVELSEHNRIQMVWVPGHMGLMDMKQLIN
jgi:hypothetical protein